MKKEIKKEKIKKPIIKKDKKIKSGVNLKNIIIAVIILISIICISYAVIIMNKDSKMTIYVEQGTIHQEETVVGYIIRNEKVIKNDEYQNGIIQIADEGEKVYKNEAIFQYYSDEAKELSTQVRDINFQIQEKLKTEPERIVMKKRKIRGEEFENITLEELFTILGIIDKRHNV